MVDPADGAIDHGHGVDCGLRDPFGNQIRILQPAARQATAPASKE